MDYIIGVDGGGTKTEAIAYNMEDKIIGTGMGGSGNLALDYDTAATNITNAITQCADCIKTQGIDGECKGIYLGIAGIEVGKNVKRIEASIAGKFHCNVVGLHDSELAYAAFLEDKDGIITISGTGSVSYGRYKGKSARSGGWGHVLGDEGSGYWIALEALKKMTTDYDNGVDTSLLSQSILKYLGICNVADIEEYAHKNDKMSIAAIVPVVVSLAQDGDQAAIKILDQAGNELAVMTERLYKRLGMNGQVIIGISGSVLSKNDRVREAYKRRLEKDLGDVRILTKNTSPTKGACYLYRRDFERMSCL